MKKIIILLFFIFGLSILNSCTPQALNDTEIVSPDGDDEKPPFPPYGGN